jgi:hypothetical protein
MAGTATPTIAAFIEDDRAVASGEDAHCSRNVALRPRLIAAYVTRIRFVLSDLL